MLNCAGEYLLRNRRRWWGISVKNWVWIVIPIWLPEQQLQYATGLLINPGVFAIISKWWVYIPNTLFLGQYWLLVWIGQRYKSAHRNENWSNSLPPVSAVQPLTNQTEVERWLFQSLGMRLATRRMMSNPDIRRALWIVFVACLRYPSIPNLFPSLSE
jgi:hypothetical protein